MISVRINGNFPLIAPRTSFVRVYMFYKDPEEKEFFVIFTSREKEDLVKKY